MLTPVRSKTEASKPRAEGTGTSQMVGLADTTYTMRRLPAQKALVRNPNAVSPDSTSNVALRVREQLKMGWRR